MTDTDDELNRDELELIRKALIFYGAGQIIDPDVTQEQMDRECSRAATLAAKIERIRYNGGSLAVIPF